MDRFNPVTVTLLIITTLLAAPALAQQSIQELDLLIQSAAFQRLAPLPKTGVIYNVTLLESPSSSSSSPPSPLSSSIARIQAVRLRAGSLRRHGLEFNEFSIPVQSLVETSSKYVVLIYRSFSLYPSPVPPGLALLGPVSGIKAYEGNNLSPSPPAQEVSIFSGSSSIMVRPQADRRSSRLLPPLCATFDKEQVFRQSNVSSSSPASCSLSQLADSALAVEADEILAPAPAPTPAPTPAPAPAPESEPVSVTPASSTLIPGVASSRNRRHWKAWKLGVGVSLGGIGLAMLLLLLGFAAVRTRNRARIARMEYCAENSESLQTALIGGSRAPAAAGTRTRPVLETDYLSP